MTSIGGAIVLALEGVLVVPAAGTKECRERINKFLARSKEVTGAAATVLGGGGFVNGALRAVVTATILLSRPTHPSKIFTNSGDATQWLLPYCHASWTTADRADCARQIMALEQQMSKVAIAARHTTQFIPNPSYSGACADPVRAFRGCPQTPSVPMFCKDMQR